MSADTLSKRPAARKQVERRKPGRPSGSEAGALHQIYLQAALDTFLVRGYERTSIEEIARVAKASKMTFYRLFGSKDELFRLVAHHAITKVRERLQASLATEGEPEQVLHEMIVRLHTGLTDPEYLAVLRLVIAETERFPELGEAMLSDDHYLFEPIVDYLRRTAAAGKLAIPDPYAATMQLAALASGGGRFLIKKPRTDPESREQWVAAVLKFVLDAWQPRSPRSSEH